MVDCCMRWIFILLISCLVSAAAAPASQEWRLRYAALTTRDPESCRLEPERGLCYAAFTLYYFDAAAGTCEEFLYGGCGGNANRFGSLEECLATCARASDVAAAGDATRKPAQGAHRRRGDASSSSAAVASHANGVAGLQQAAATRPWTTPAHASPELLALNLRREPLSTPDTAAFISPDLLRPADGERVWDAARL